MLRDRESDLSDLRSVERVDLSWALDGAHARQDHRDMDPSSFHRLRTAVQENAVPAGSLEVFELERRLQDELESSGFFDQIEVGSTADPDQLVIALCRCQADVPPWEAGYRLERVWAGLRSQASWEAHSATATEEVMEFEAAMTMPDGRQFLTMHVVALRHAEVAAGMGDEHNGAGGARG